MVRRQSDRGGVCSYHVVVVVGEDHALDQAAVQDIVIGHVHHCVVLHIQPHLTRQILIGHKEVQESVLVDVGEVHGVRRSLGEDPCVEGDVGEGSARSVVQQQSIDMIQTQPTSTHDEDIQIPIVVDIRLTTVRAAIDPHQVRFLRHILKLSIPYFSVTAYRNRVRKSTQVLVVFDVAVV